MVPLIRNFRIAAASRQPMYFSALRWQRFFAPRSETWIRLPGGPARDGVT